MIPTRDEYIKMKDKHLTFDDRERSISYQNRVSQWSKPKYLCPECGGYVCRNLILRQTISGLDESRKSLYRCQKCGFEEYITDQE